MWKDIESTEPLIGTIVGVGTVDKTQLMSDGGNPFLLILKIFTQIEDEAGTLDLIIGFDEEAASMMIAMIERMADEKGIRAAYTAKLDQMRSELTARIAEKAKDKD